MYRGASHLWLSFSHNRTKINIQFLSILQKIEISVQKSKCFRCQKWNYQVRFIWKYTNIYISVVCLKYKASVFQYVYTFQVFVLLEK